MTKGELYVVNFGLRLEENFFGALEELRSCVHENVKSCKFTITCLKYLTMVILCFKYYI